jgi:hypothetical protein
MHIPLEAGAELLFDRFFMSALGKGMDKDKSSPTLHSFLLEDRWSRQKTLTEPK